MTTSRPCEFMVWLALARIRRHPRKTWAERLRKNPAKPYPPTVGLAVGRGCLTGYKVESHASIFWIRIPKCSEEEGFGMEINACEWARNWRKLWGERYRIKDELGTRVKHGASRCEMENTEYACKKRNRAGETVKILITTKLNERMTVPNNSIYATACHRCPSGCQLSATCLPEEADRTFQTQSRTQRGRLVPRSQQYVAFFTLTPSFMAK